MRIDVLCISRRPPRWVSEATGAYAGRLPRGFALEFVHLAPGRAAQSPAARRHDEGERLLRRCADGQPLIALAVDGRAGDSAAFAARLGRLREEHRTLALAIGGADGLGDNVLGAARERWSLSPLTLPHWLVQVVLAEQVYRAWTILEGHPYHRA